MVPHAADDDGTGEGRDQFGLRLEHDPRRSTRHLGQIGVLASGSDRLGENAGVLDAELAQLVDAAIDVEAVVRQISYGTTGRRPILPHPAIGRVR